MSVSDSAISTSNAADVEHLSRAESRSGRLVGRLERAGEWLNPLLVKECRQALKSRQFALTFAAVLSLCWGWSILSFTELGLGPTARSSSLAARSSYVFLGFYCILAVPLLIIVPFFAFRSLIAEQEDSTYELVAITSLRPHQIVGGKLGSAAAQMLVFLSAAAPCLAFTYLLGGIDILTIGCVLLYTTMGSLGLSMCAVFLATTAADKVWQALFSIGIAIALLFIFLGAIELAEAILRYPPWRYSDFWITNLAMLLGYASSFGVLYQAAAARLTFTAENRSTALRCWMLVQQLLFVGFIGYLFTYESQLRERQVMSFFVPILIVMSATLTSLYWFVMGSLMTGENPELSQRVQRTLPRSTLGRAFLTWLYPGPSTGYVFAVANFSTLCICAWAAFAVITGQQQYYGRTALFTATATSYFAGYLGFGNLLMLWLRRFTTVSLVLAALLQFLLVLAGVAGPSLIQEFSGSHNWSYSWLHITNPFYTCSEIIEAHPTAMIVAWLILAAGCIIFVLNLIVLAPRILARPIAKPPRMLEEDAALEPALPPPPATSPWD